MSQKLPAHLLLNSQENSPDIFSRFLPLIIVTTVQTIMAQTNEQGSLHDLFSCVLIGEKTVTESLGETLSQLLAKTNIAPLQYYSLPAFRDKGFYHRYDLAMMVLEPNAVLSQFSDILVNCRDLSARHVLAIVPSSQNLTAFGFAKVEFLDENGQMLRLDNTDYTVWQFNLFDYKQLPDWFNSRFWANPENWNKFRW